MFFGWNKKKSLSNEEEYFEGIIKDNLDSVYSFVYQILKDENEAEDVVQETFLKVWRNLKKYNKKKDLKPWLFTIAHNTAMDFIRKRKHMVFSDFEREDGSNMVEDSLVDEEPLALEAFSNFEDVEKLKSVIEKLPSFYKEVLFLRYNQDLTFEEIGEILGKSLNTVKSQHRRALLKIKEVMHQN